MKTLTLSILILFTSLSFGQNDTCVSNVSLGLSFPPVEVDSQRIFTQTHLDILGMDRVRFAEHWGLREPSPGVFNWAGLDQRLVWADTNDIDILLTIQSDAAPWACTSTQNPQSCVFNNNTEFQFYVDSLLKRHPNKIEKIQFGNEWQDFFWYAGNAQEFIDANNILYNSVQQYSPSTEVVLGGFTTISLKIAAGCNGAVNSVFDDQGTVLDQAWFTANCSTPAFVATKARIDSVLTYAQYDIIDLHLYDDVEQWDEYYYNFADTVTRPILVSEFGGPNLNYEPYTLSYHADRVYEYIKKIDSIGITEAYFFKLIEGGANPAHNGSGLLDSLNLLEKPAYYIFQAFEDCPLKIEEKVENTLDIYPNPAINFLQIGGELFWEDILIITDLSGRLVMRNYAKSEMDISRIPNGIYIVNLEREDRVIKTSKLIISR